MTVRYDSPLIMNRAVHHQRDQWTFLFQEGFARFCPISYPMSEAPEKHDLDLLRKAEQRMRILLGRARSLSSRDDPDFVQQCVEWFVGAVDVVESLVESGFLRIEGSPEKFPILRNSRFLTLVLGILRQKRHAVFTDRSLILVYVLRELWRSRHSVSVIENTWTVKPGLTFGNVNSEPMTCYRDAVVRRASVLCKGAIPPFVMRVLPGIEHELADDDDFAYREGVKIIGKTQKEAASLPIDFLKKSDGKVPTGEVMFVCSFRTPMLVHATTNFTGRVRAWARNLIVQAEKSLWRDFLDACHAFFEFTGDYIHRSLEDAHSERPIAEQSVVTGPE